MERNPFLGWPGLLQQKPRSVREVTGVRRDKEEIKTDETGTGSSSGCLTGVDKRKWLGLMPAKHNQQARDKKGPSQK